MVDKQIRDYDAAASWTADHAFIADTGTVSEYVTRALIKGYFDTVYATTGALGAYLPLAGGILTGTLTARQVDVQAGYALTVGGGPELGILTGPYPALWLSDLAHTQYTYALAYDPGTDDLLINTPAMGNIKFRISNVDQISIDVAGKLWTKAIDIAAGSGLTVDTDALVVTPTTKTVTMAGSLAVDVNVLAVDSATNTVTTPHRFEAGGGKLIVDGALGVAGGPGGFASALFLLGLAAGTVAPGGIGVFGAALVEQQTAAGTVTGFVQGSGNAVNDVSTFTGDTGSTAYTVGDIVRCLKAYGWLEV